MGKTLTYGDAINNVGQYGARVENDIARMFAVNSALNTLWNAADWRETIAPLPPFWLFPGAQDHGKPAAVVPTDFHGLREVYLIYAGADYANRKTLEVQSNLDITHIREFPTRICYDPTIGLGTGGFRVWPRVPDGIGATQYMIDGTYKKRATKITPATLNSVLPWDDEYFHVFCAVLFWALQKPGNTKDQALQDAWLYVQDMMDKEGLNAGDPSRAPSKALVDPFQRF